MTKKGKHKKKLVESIVILIRNTTWKCGRLERLIVRHLSSRKAGLGKPQMPLKDMIQNFSLAGKKKSEFLDAIKRLERRNIIRILRL
ncbi:MAG: hypothetical protein QW468_04235 [Candidatus Bathyarchaeia archaeon]